MLELGGTVIPTQSVVPLGVLLVSFWVWAKSALRHGVSFCPGFVVLERDVASGASRAVVDAFATLRSGASLVQQTVVKVFFTCSERDESDVLERDVFEWLHECSLAAVIVLIMTMTGGFDIMGPCSFLEPRWRMLDGCSF